MNTEPSKLAASYDCVAEEYGDEFFKELDRKPFDRELLGRFAEIVGAGVPVCDMGCGPGQIARFLQDRGLSMRGIDLSAEMIKCARRVNPDISFETGDMLHLELPDESLAAIVSFYAIIHLARDDVTRGLREMYRVLKPEGRLLISFHEGEGELHRDRWYDKAVSIDVTLIQIDEMSRYLESAGFEVESILRRDPYEFEYPIGRVYALSQKPPQAK
jgi:ubiquinone/menaquinone biosynthesis C-methylase UbiE